MTASTRRWRRRAEPPRAGRRALVPLALILGAVGCSPPVDRDPQRPSADLATSLTQRDLVLDGLRIRYVDEGPRNAVALPVVLIPGHTSRIEEYDGLVPILSARRRVLVLDFPGSGYASKPVREYDLRFYEDVLLAFLDALAVPRAQLAGGSLGGNLTLRLGHRAPERFPRLAPWAPGSAWPARPRVAALMRALGGWALFWPVVRAQSTFWYDESWPGRERALADTFAYYDEVLGPGFVHMYWGMAADQVGRSLFGLAPQIAQPTWLGWGDRDHGGGMGDGVARLHALLPDSRLRVYPGAGHALASEIPEALARDLDAFLAGSGTP